MCSPELDSGPQPGALTRQALSLWQGPGGRLGSPSLSTAWLGSEGIKSIPRTSKIKQSLWLAASTWRTPYPPNPSIYLTPTLTLLYKLPGL